MFFFAGLSHVGGLRASGGGGDGTGDSNGTKQSANAVGLERFRFLGFGLVWGASKKWLWAVVVDKEELVDCWFLGEKLCNPVACQRT